MIKNFKKIMKESSKGRKKLKIFIALPAKSLVDEISNGQKMLKNNENL